MTVKVLGREGNKVRVGDYGILWGDEKNRDRYGDFFDTRTQGVTSIFDRMGAVPLLFHHGLDAEIKADVIGRVDVMRPDDVGLWVEAVIDDSDAYRKEIAELVRLGKLFYSSGAAPGPTLAALRSRNGGGHVPVWPIYEVSLTPRPAEWRMLYRSAPDVAKAYKAIGLDFPTGAEDAQGGESEGRINHINIQPKQGDTMNIHARLSQTVLAAKAAYEEGDLVEGNRLTDEAEALQVAIKRYEALDNIDATAAEQALMRPPLPVGKSASAEPPASAGVGYHAPYILRYGDETDAMKAVARDVIGPSYQQLLHEQVGAFAKYLRGGERVLDRDAYKVLRTQIFPFDQIRTLLDNGMDVATIRATMVEAQGDLGGFAVPAQVQSDFIRRMPGLTAVRAAGAKVIPLLKGNYIEVPEYTGGNDQYVGALRGQWGSETQAPNPDNATIGMQPLIANVYTYKVPMSRSLVEDAANLVDLVTTDIVTTAAIDEDNAFLTGNGVGKPEGILPGSANSHSLQEVVSGNASALTTNGVRILRRGVATQYRRNLAMIFNSDTGAAIEQLTVSGTGSDFAYDLSQDRLYGANGPRIFESEAMPDVAANAYPIIVGDISGYWIVDGPGLTIERYTDSNTGINKVEFHIRRRVGGKVVETFKLAVQKVSA